MVSVSVQVAKSKFRYQNSFVGPTEIGWWKVCKWKMVPVQENMINIILYRKQTKLNALSTAEK